DKKFQTFSNAISKHFTIALLTIAIGSALFWLISGDSGKAWGAFTAVLIIACPCALALSSPFTLSAALSIFDKNKFFIKNTAAIEQLAEVDTLVFDKTGTITSPETKHIHFSGKLTDTERKIVASVCRNSSHPLSVQLIKWLAVSDYIDEISNYQEKVGEGIQAMIMGKKVKIGSAKFTNADIKQDRKSTRLNSSHVKISYAVFCL